jgi:ABC-type uncharacterized transport system substrate-binding protein
MKVLSTNRILIGLIAFSTMTMAFAGDDAAAATKKCLFVSSYHRGYEHSDAIERGLRAVLQGKCEVRQFDMDAKRRPDEAGLKQRALEAKDIIQSWRPDIVITADDEAAKYLVQPHFRDAKLPFVFCGLNWTAAEYGFPYSNATGMIEVAPIVPMMERAKDIVPSFARAFYIGADTLVEGKNLKRFQDAAERLGFKLDHKFVNSTDGWIEAYAHAQQYDVVIVGNSEGIKDWDAKRVRAAMLRTTRKLSVTNHGWMMPYTILGVTKVSEEQGEWAAKTALRILDGIAPSQIPIIPNNQRDIWINADILEASNVQLPDDVLRKGKKVAGLESQ